MSDKITLEQIGLSNNDLTAIGKLSETGLTPQEIADNVKYGVNNFINTSNPSIGLQYVKTKKELTKAISPFTGSIVIKLTGIQSVDIDGTMVVTIKADGLEPTRELLISGHWRGNNENKIWTAGHVREITTADTPVDVMFARNSTDTYIVLFKANKVHPNTRIAIDRVMTNYNPSINLGFEISTLTNLSGLILDIETKDNLIGVETAEKINNVVNTYKEIIVLTQAEYDAIVTKDPNKIYMIEEA